MPALQVIECPKGFHKTTQTCSGVSPGEGSTLCNLSGRHIADGAVQGSSLTAHSTCSFSIGESGFSDQLPQVSSGAITTIGIPWIPCGHSQERAQVTKGKDREDQEGSYQLAGSRRCVSNNPGQSSGSDDSGSYGSVSSSNPLQGFTEAEAQGTSCCWLRWDNKGFSRGQTGSQLVVIQPVRLEWKGSGTAEPRDIYRDRCIPFGTGHSLPGRKFWRLLELRREIVQDMQSLGNLRMYWLVSGAGVIM